ncbi:hypothetical protein TRFO_02461 [Tritrichomonas foetus]|uniref:Uncharacterized protein n=1 Tax=Tritrichomonas foetus TaxID=1144522 RepID=A0A1J4L681_9EUKA|nr:hypothetical protein TRFO_02461 [Tritrichomonas foetus]|eukprot:OHT17453.1 hypothetical protein TRFO_02461 [Tritrichomonas foetus]
MSLNSHTASSTMKHSSLYGSNTNPNNFSGSLSTRSYVKTSVDHRNPRQHEIWEMQSNHQNRLNYLHFKARLDGYDEREDERKTTNFSSQLSSEHYALEMEEKELIETLRQEKKLLEEAKVNTKLEVDRCKKMLEDFRIERKKKLSEKKSENSSRRKIYEEELESLRQTIANEKTDIKVSIHQIDYMSQPDAEDVSALNKSYDLREQILRSQANSLKTKSSLTTKTSSTVSVKNEKQ